MRILVVDDNRLVRSGVAHLLSSESGWEVFEAGDGESAIQMACQLVPDVILLDVSMPGLSGLETATRLRQQVPNVKILMLSQHDAALLLPHVLAAGAQGFVDKSRLNTDLLPAIKNLSS
ncbi:MAG TPA: response regulator transcription factor [Candidatus Acidoferrum sp.]|nr:response regulator transcription factor [Candidatus Acidoferrum sp.]